LKCCLNFELDQYVEALRDFPSVNTRLRLPKGTASHFKTDIFQRIMFFTYDGQPGEPPFPLSTDSVKEIIEKNKKGIEIEDIDDFLVEETVEKETDFAEVVGQDSLTRFDKSRNRSRGGRNRGRKNDGRGPQDRGSRPPRPEGENKGGSEPRSDRGPRLERQDRAPRPNQGPPRDGGAPRGERAPKEMKNPGQPSTTPSTGGNEPKGDRDNRGRGGRRNQRGRGPRPNDGGSAQAPNNPPA
jgi:hypothetical protein